MGVYLVEGDRDDKAVGYIVADAVERLQRDLQHLGIVEFGGSLPEGVCPVVIKRVKGTGSKGQVPDPLRGPTLSVCHGGAQSYGTSTSIYNISPFHPTP